MRFILESHYIAACGLCLQHGRKPRRRLYTVQFIFVTSIYPTFRLTSKQTQMTTHWHTRRFLFWNKARGGTFQSAKRAQNVLFSDVKSWDPLTSTTAGWVTLAPAAHPRSTMTTTCEGDISSADLLFSILFWKLLTPHLPPVPFHRTTPIPNPRSLPLLGP